MYVDFHSHVLPGADHGSDSLEMSLSQLSFAKAAGVDTIIATPHFYPDVDNIPEFLARREAAFRELESANTTGIELIRGAEVQLGINLDKEPELPKLCIEGTDYILIEFPPEPWPCWTMDAVMGIIRDRRLRPICAHLDRVSHIGREKILKLNIDVQINPSSMLDTRRHRHYYLDLIADDAVHVLGSDTHGDGKLSYKDFSLAIKKIGKLMPYLTANARKIIASGKKIPR
ncbi:MAG: hypothetical protein IJ299_02820 [Oscillospiraceae bacterium]|nr:hypothetical protein [Oscillospiraceae bacterium]